MIEATIARDSQGFPSLVTLQDGAKRLEVAFDRDAGFTITGSRRSFTTELLDVLRMIYPATVDFKLDLPQPLQVANVSAPLLFDDFEGLLKFAGVNVALDAANAYNGGQCLSVFNEAAAGQRYATRIFPLTAEKIEFSVFFGVSDFTVLNTMTVYIRNYNGVEVRGGGVQLDRTNAVWRMTDTADVLMPYRALDPHDGVEGAWHYLRFVMDLKASTLTEFQINDRSIITNVPLYRAADAGAEQTTLSLYVNNVPANDVYGYFDDVQIKAVT